MAKLACLTIFICLLQSFCMSSTVVFCRCLRFRREEKVEDAAETGGPGVFVVSCVWGLEVVEIDSVAPAAELEAAVQEVGVVDVLTAFRGAYV